MAEERVRTMGAVRDEEDEAHDALVEGRRVLSWVQLREYGVEGLEGMVWRAMERVACEEGGVWMEGSVCANIRGYVERAVEGWRELRGECV